MAADKKRKYENSIVIGVASFEAKMKNVDKEARHDKKWVSPGSLCCVRHSCKECFRVGVEVLQVRTLHGSEGGGGGYQNQPMQQTAP